MSYCSESSCCNAWCDVGELSDDVPDDFEGLDASTAHIVNLHSSEPTDVKLGIGGFSMGAATTLYSATCFCTRKIFKGIRLPYRFKGYYRYKWLASWF